MASSIVKNAIVATVTFEDANGDAADPSESGGVAVTWTVYGEDQATVRSGPTTQALADKTGTGTFAFTYVPTAVETIYIEAVATVGGVQQAARTVHEVTWVA